MISIHNLSKRFGDHAVLDGVCLGVARGETVALLGPSGSGKTTLLRCLNGLEWPDDGAFEVDDIRVAATDRGRLRADKMREIRRRCGFVFQQFNLFPHRTVLDNLTLAPILVRKLTREEARTKALELLGQVGLEHAAEKKPSKLSGGEQQRVAIARALAMEPDILLYDEPTSSLDAERAQEVWAIMRRLSAAGQTQLIVTHQEELAACVADRVIRLRDGRVIDAPMLSAGK
jgi:ABC-type polar amino acid transport system ATPase subunit